MHVTYVQFILYKALHNLQDYSAEELKLWVKNLLLPGMGNH
jgi:hypothetical protein